MEGRPPPPQAGWYPDPAGSGQRYWDGQRWTDQAADQPAGAAAVQRPRTDGFAIAALILSILGGILLSAIFALVALSRIRQGKRTGRGLAIAALVINVVWIAVIVLAITVWTKPDAERYTGEQRRIAAVVDGVEEAADNDDAAALCRHFTPEFQREAATRKGSCPRLFAPELEGKVQAPIEVERIEIHGPSRATAFVDEGGESQRWRMEKIAGEWKVAEVV